MCTLICVTVYQKCKCNGIVGLGLSSFLLALTVKSVAIADSLDVTSTDGDSDNQLQLNPPR